MNISAGQTILLQVATGMSNIKDLLEQRAVYESLAEKITASYSLAPAHTNDDQDKTRWIIKVLEMDERIEAAKKNNKDTIDNAMKVISVLPSARTQMIFYRRYILNEQWNEVLRHMEKEDDDLRVCSVRTMMRLHSDGLKFLYDYEAQQETIYCVA